MDRQTLLKELGDKEGGAEAAGLWLLARSEEADNVGVGEALQKGNLVGDVDVGLRAPDLDGDLTFISIASKGSSYVANEGQGESVAIIGAQTGAECQMAR